MSEPLTDRQRECLDLLIEAALHGEPPPTMREIGEAMGIKSTNGVGDHLRALERKGYIDKDDRKSRSIRVVGLWPRPPVAARSEPARVYTFRSVSKAAAWWNALGPEFSGRMVETLDGSGVTEIVVTRVTPR